MNYLRGAVNAISAPYQYYSTINPSTLTGAIDVIVIQRPDENGTTELVCSPFHVRFGKWQVLRPSDKKVDVAVNGRTIPFNMKIGDAGEAFFVFETDDDVPADLITSPIIEPEDKPEQLQAPTENDRPPREGTLEPEYLDLNASPDDETKPNLNLTTPRPPSHLPAGLANQHVIDTSDPTRTPEMVDQDRRVDEALKAIKYDLHVPKVEYHEDVALDARGYHSLHGRDGSERTLRSTDECQNAEADSELSLHGYQRQDRQRLSASLSFPSIRATSEPPPDVDAHDQAPSSKLSPMQEYSWEWGAFPQPSPLQTSFSKNCIAHGRDSATWSKGKSRMMSTHVGRGMPDSDSARDGAEEADQVRSHSVPPALDGSPSQMRRTRELPSEYEEDIDGQQRVEDLKILLSANGFLRASKLDPKRLVLVVEDRKLVFELSIPTDEGGSGEESEGERKERGRKFKGGAHGGKKVFDPRNPEESERMFDRGRIDFDQFVDDESIVHDLRLIMRWTPNQYITRQDSSPFMTALVHWREAIIKQRIESISRPLSPTSEDEAENEPSMPYNRSKSEPPESNPQDDAKATQARSSTLSWMPWWSRSRRKQDTVEDKTLARAATANDIPSRRSSVKEIPHADSAPALPSTPIQKPITAPAVQPPTQEPPTSKRYAKTLRLTSDQLKSLDLKRGANQITFSLSSTGIIACSARIFVWESVDHVVISDIDGTITKSDGLGHVFAMIGRDWTHLGVAKLYTDICRNGYKIMYLTSRAIGQADATRDYLKGIKQNNHQLPEGPVIMSPDRLMASLHREVIQRKPEVFKMACLRDIRNLFSETSKNPFYAGFGNRITDALSYRSVNVPSSRIFTIDSTSEVRMDLLELAGYKSSYIHMTDLVDQMFPPIHRKWTPEFTDFNYWKAPLQDFPLPDLSPPSPALSARSDNSNRSALARLRNFSLGTSRHSTMLPLEEDAAYPHINGEKSNTAPDGQESGLTKRSSQLIQMASFEKLSNTLGFGSPSRRDNANTNGDGWGRDRHRRSTSSGSVSVSSQSFSYASSDGESEEEEQWVDDGTGKKELIARRRKSSRRRSMTSMPGSLDDKYFGFDEDEDEGFGYEGQGHRGHDGEEGYGDEYEYGDDQRAQEDDEPTFDEDFMAAVEMKKVPFI